jgi:serine O-acetyltransferase
VDSIHSTARHLRAAREKSDPVSIARTEEVPESGEVLEVHERLRGILLDRSPEEDLESDLHVVHGLLTRLIGETKADRLVERLPDIRHCMSLDVEAAYQGDPAATSYAEIIAAYPSCQAVFTYRVAHALYELGEPTIARIMAENAHNRTGIDIHPGAEIGCHFFIDHGTGVVIGETTVIGNRVKLYHGVTLGAFSNRKGRGDRGSKRHPTIEDDVTIYPNATALGGQTVIGRGSVIGGNAWLTRSVPPYTRVTAEPSRLQLSQAREGADTPLDWEI